MSSARVLPAVVVASLACSRTPTTPASSDAAPIAVPNSRPGSEPRDSAGAPAAPVGAQGAIEDWVLARLRTPGQELRHIEYDWQDMQRARPGIVATRAYYVDDPAMWLLIVRFGASGDAAAARGPLLQTAKRANKSPYYAEATTSGAYLLIIGYATHKPVSPEMERHLKAYLSAFAGAG